MRTSPSLVFAALVLLQNPSSPPGFMLGSGALSGRVLVPNGVPPRRVLINAMRRVKQPDGQVVTKMGQSGMLDPSGEYRFRTLPPGDYIVVARPASPDLAATRLPDGRTAFAPTYYPGTADPDAARVIRLAANDSVVDVNFTIVPDRARLVSGIVIDANGAPVSPASLALSASTRDMVGGPMPPVVTLVRPDGTFTLEPVPKGVYTVRATRLAPNGRGDFGFVFGPAGERLTPDGPPASVDVSVGDTDVSGVRLVIPAGR